MNEAFWGPFLGCALIALVLAVFSSEARDQLKRIADAVEGGSNEDDDGGRKLMVPIDTLNEIREKKSDKVVDISTRRRP